MADPYLQSDGRTLHNKLGIVSDTDRLEQEEANRTFLRRAELRTQGLPNIEGFGLVRATHHYLFQDVYSWAGETRTTSLTKLHHVGSSARTTFTPPTDIERAGTELFDAIDREQGLRGLSSRGFVDRLAAHFNTLNIIHPFREGNGRTQRIVWEHIARMAGHSLAFEGVSKERMIAASIAGERGDLDVLRRMFEELLDPERRQALVTATRFLETARSANSSFDWNERYVATTTPGQRYSGSFVGADGRNFMLGLGSNIFVGMTADLPSKGSGLKPGDTISFEARHPVAEPINQGVLAKVGRVIAERSARRRSEEGRLHTPIAGREPKAKQTAEAVKVIRGPEEDAKTEVQPPSTTRGPSP